MVPESPAAHAHALGLVLRSGGLIIKIKSRRRQLELCINTLKKVSFYLFYGTAFSVPSPKYKPSWRREK